MDGAHLITTERGNRVQTGGPARRLFTLLVAALTVAAGVVLTAPPAAAVTPGSGALTGGVETVAGTVNSVSGGAATYDNTAANTTTITVSGPRTIINWNDFTLPAGQTLNVVVNSTTDVVLFRVGSGAGTVNGTLRSFLGSTGGGFAGNVWLTANAGLAFGRTAQADVGGLLALTGDIGDADVLDGDGSFTLAGSPESWRYVTVGDWTPGTGAGIRGHGSLVGLVGRSVNIGYTDQIGAAPGSRSELLVASARDALLEIVARPDGGGYDLMRFQPSGSTSSAGVAAAGTLTAADVYVSSTAVTSAPNTVSTYTRAVTANGAPASGDGDFVMAFGGGLARSTPSAAVQPQLAANSPAQIGSMNGVTRASRSIVVSGSDRVDFSYGADVGAPAVAVASRGGMVNFEGTSAINSAATAQWVLYAPQPSNVQHPNAASTNPDVNGTLDSGQRAVWGGTLETRPPSSVTGNRYVFSNPPDITVTAENKSKNFDQAFAAGVPTPLTATVTGDSPHPGIPGLFLGDAAPTFVGSPSLSSTGQAHTAPERPGGYPIVVSQGDMSSPLGYDLVFVDATLTVDDTSPPTVTPVVTGTQGDDGWYRSTVGLTWSIVDPGTAPTSITGVGCGPVSVTADQNATDYTCTGSSLGGTAAPVTASIKRDASAPVLTVSGVSDGQAYVPGSWTDANVAITYTCDGAISGVASEPDDTVASATGAYGGTCTDNAGNTHSVPFQVNIDEVDPTVGDVTFTLAESDGTYVPGTWTNQRVLYSWTCADTGGSNALNGGAGGHTDSSLLFYAVCEDHAGNSARSPDAQILVDKADPTIVSPALTSGGNPYTSGSWSRTPVTLTWSCADTGSGPAQPGGTETRSTSGTLTATCTDAAGNPSTQTFEVLIDATAPAIGGVTLTTPDGAAFTSGAWTRQDVVLSWTCTDGTGQSGATKATDSVTATATGGLRAVCTDVAGNSAQGELFRANIDRTEPTIVEPTLTSGGNPYTQGSFARGPVTLTWDCADDDSGPALPGGEESLTTSGTLTATCTDNAGNQATQQFAALVDATAPAIGGLTLTTADGLPYTSGTWTSQAVTLAWTCTDGPNGSGATGPTGSATTTSTGALRAVCTDVAGNSAQGELFQANIDTVAPVLAGIPAAQSVTTSGTTGAVTWTAPTATDDQDGSPTVACTPASGSAFPVGVTTVTCTATDDAGNSDSEQFTVTVTQQAAPPAVGVVHRAPVDAAPVMNVAAWGRVVPVRISLTGVGNPLVDDVEALSLGTPTRVACSVASRTDTVETYIARAPRASNLFTWDRRPGNWLARLDTRTLARNACYEIPIMYGGTVTGQMATGGQEIGSFLLQARSSGRGGATAAV